MSNFIFDEFAIFEVEAAEVSVFVVADNIIMEGLQEGAVGDDEDAGVRIGGIAGEKVVEERLRASEDGLDRLEAMGVSVLANTEVVDTEVIPVDDLPFEVAVITLDEAIVIHYIGTIVSDDFGGFLGAAEGRSVNIVKLEIFGNDAVAEGFGLSETGGVQFDVGDALGLFLDVPVGLAVTDEIKFHGGLLLIIDLNETERSDDTLACVFNGADD